MNQRDIFNPDRTDCCVGSWCVAPDVWCMVANILQWPEKELTAIVLAQHVDEKKSSSPLLPTISRRSCAGISVHQVFHLMRWVLLWNASEFQNPDRDGLGLFLSQQTHNFLCSCTLEDKGLNISLVWSYVFSMWPVLEPLNNIEKMDSIPMPIFRLSMD